KGFQYAKVLYNNQGQEESGWLTGQMMANIAASVNGLNMQQWYSAVNDPTAKSIASAVDQVAKQKKVQGTPTILVGCNGGTLQDITGPQVAPNLQDTEQALNAAAHTCS